MWFFVEAWAVCRNPAETSRHAGWEVAPMECRTLCADKVAVWVESSCGSVGKLCVADVVFLDEPVELSPIDPQGPRGARLVAGNATQHFDDFGALDAGQI